MAAYLQLAALVLLLIVQISYLIAVRCNRRKVMLVGASVILVLLVILPRVAALLGTYVFSPLLLHC